MKAIFANIIDLEVDAIVNAANTSLLGGGGVDGAIHRAAGYDLVHECRKLGGCKVGEAKLTAGYDLQHAKYIIHTVGPVWNGGGLKEGDLLGYCYKSALVIAEDHPQIQSVAFPCISTGIYAFPITLAALIAVESCRSSPLDITFCCFSKHDLEVYEELLN